MHLLQEYTTQASMGLLSLMAANLTDGTLHQAMSTADRRGIRWRLLMTVPVVAIHEYVCSETDIDGCLSFDTTIRLALGLWRIMLTLSHPNI